MPDFGNGKIYRINVGDRFYIGSTTLSLNQRWCNHKQMIGMRSRLYRAMAECEGDMMMWLVENFPCNSRAELVARENFHILQHRDDPQCLNMVLSYRTPEEKRAYHKQYRETKKQCECGAHITAGNLATHRKSKLHRARLENVIHSTTGDHHHAVV
jgi:hypothetical protein